MLVFCWFIKTPHPSASQTPSPQGEGCKKSTLAGAFLDAIAEFCFSVRKILKFRKFRKKFQNLFRFFHKQKLFRFWKLFYAVFEFSCAGFGIGFPKSGQIFHLMASGVFCGGSEPVVMDIYPMLYIIGKAGIKRIILTEKGIYPIHQISRTARTLLSSLGSPTTKPAFLKSLFARLFSREYAAQSFFASPRGISFTILIAS